MQKHTRNFFKHYKLGVDDIIPCMICRGVAVDLHHILKRSSLGSDDQSNLIALCRACHETAEARGYSEEKLLEYKADFDSTYNFSDDGIIL